MCVVNTRRLGRTTILDEYDFFKCRQGFALVQEFCSVGLF